MPLVQPPPGDESPRTCMSPHPGDHGAGLATSGNALRVAGLRRGAPQNIPTRLWLLLSFEKELFKLPVPHAEKKSTPWHPLILPHAPWASLDLPRLLLLSATCSSPVPMSWPRARRGHSPGARPQRLRGLGLPCGRGSRWGPQAEPTGAGSSSTWLVLLALPPRAAQGERSCWGLAWSPVEQPPPTDRAQAWGGTRTQGSAAPRRSAGLFLWTPGRVGVPGRAPFSLPALWPPWSPS